MSSDPQRDKERERRKMAEAVIVSIAEKIFSILSSQAIETVGKFGGIKRELRALKDTIFILQRVLDHAEEQYHEFSYVQVWVEKLKDAFYEAQDVLEEFDIEAMRRELRASNEMMKEVLTFFSSSNQLAFNWKMSDKVREVRMRIEDLNNTRTFNLEERSGRVWSNREETHSFIPKGDIKGRDDDKKKVMEFLQDSNVEENVSILPIIGLGGTGKTALAQYVYGDSEFDLKMWISVPFDFDVQKIVKMMLACAKVKVPTESTMELLQNKLRKEIDGNKYLLVLDDVWNIQKEKWLQLKILLWGGARGSKILVTTRISSIVDIMETATPLSLEGLGHSASLELLMQMAGRKIEEIQDSNMLAISKEIVRKCSGNPLVVRTIGSLLFYKKSEHEWSHFKDNELPDISQREDRIVSVLKLSYDHLPPHLKQCFAFCSLFPKDYEINKQTLINLWMAQGFIQPSNRGQHLEDIAHGYFMDLLWSNFFQEFREDVGTCKMHDLMHDLACSVAGTECWVAWDDTKSIHERTHHISRDLTFNLMGKPLISCLKASALRTFFTVTKFFWERIPTSEADLRRLIQSFKRLRILDFHATEVKKVPRSIYKLKHLTYLDLSHNDALKRLPNSITRLHNLQTLNLNCCSKLKELPRDIRKLVSLRNLYIDYCDLYMPCGLGQLTLLHGLSRFMLPKDKALAKKYCGLGELKRLNNIRGTLSIKNLGSVINAVEESQAANLREKCSLEVLDLSWSNFNITDESMITKRDEAVLDGLRPPDNLQKLIIDGYNGESFPRWMTELPNLVELTLKYCKRCKHFPQFGLSKLKRLDFFDMKSLEYLPGECLASLTSLESLDIKSLPRLTSLPLGLRHLSKLVTLYIWNCKELDLSKDESGNIILDIHGLQSLRSLRIDYLPKLESLPQWILQLRSLEHLGIWNCNNFKALSEQIEKCEELDISKEESGNILDFHECLRSLRSMEIYGLPKLTSLPRWLLQASNLKRLLIGKCDNLKDIPEQIEALQSLQNLVICQCNSLTSFPEAMRRLTSLTHLRIHACGKLEESCKRQAGEDWDKIAHIPNISFDFP